MSQDEIIGLILGVIGGQIIYWCFVRRPYTNWLNRRLNKHD